VGDPAVSLDFGRVLVPADPPPPAGFLTESGRRTRPAHELREFLTPYLADYGITRVAHLTGFDHVGLPVHMAVKPQGSTLSSGSGKGPTPDASWVSAVMECCEQTVWEDLDVESVHASRSMLLRTGATAVDGALLPQFKGAIWHDDLPIAWVEGWDIVSGTPMWIPESLVTVPYAHKSELKPFVSGSNGLASGAHVLEAMLSALQEAIERDGLALRTVSDPAPHAQAMALLESAAPDIAERIHRSGLQLEAIDATTEIGVPVVAAYLHEREGGTTGSFKGMGAGTSLTTALVRAVTEAAQARCLVVAGARDDVFETARSASVARTAPLRPEPELELTAGIDHATGSVLGDIEWMTGRLAAAGFPHVIVLRHSQPGDPVQVVRVVVPGLEGYPFASAQVGERGRTWTASTRLAQAAS
jgi:ribosomal protein S12 methylthiotransferase accessory factor